MDVCSQGGPTSVLLGVRICLTASSMDSPLHWFENNKFRANFLPSTRTKKKLFHKIVSCEVSSKALRATAIIKPLTRVYDIISSTNLHKTLACFPPLSSFRFLPHAGKLFIGSKLSCFPTATTKRELQQTLLTTLSISTRRSQPGIACL